MATQKRLGEWNRVKLKTGAGLTFPEPLSAPGLLARVGADWGVKLPPPPPGAPLAIRTSEASLFLALRKGQVAWELEWAAHPSASCFAESWSDPRQRDGSLHPAGPTTTRLARDMGHTVLPAPLPLAAAQIASLC